MASEGGADARPSVSEQEEMFLKLINRLSSLRQQVVAGTLSEAADDDSTFIESTTEASARPELPPLCSSNSKLILENSELKRVLDEYHQALEDTSIQADHARDIAALQNLLSYERSVNEELRKQLAGIREEAAALSELATAELAEENMTLALQSVGKAAQ